MPWDGDHRAAYAVLDDDRVEQRRVAYDWQTAVAAVRELRSASSRPVAWSLPGSRSASASLPPGAPRERPRPAATASSSTCSRRRAGTSCAPPGCSRSCSREYPERNELAREILICEQDGDRITHDIIQRLNQTFVTPIDREDIYELASALDDVVDYTEEVADFLGLYKIEAPMEQAQDLARVLHAAARQIAEAMPRLRGFQDIPHYTVEINRLENDGDRIVARGDRVAVRQRASTRWS